MRTSRNLSQEALAKELGLNRGNIASYEKGSAEPNINNLLRIAGYFQTDVTEMIENDLEEGSTVYRLLRRQDNGEQPPFELDNGPTLRNQLQEKLQSNEQQLELFKKRSDEMMKILEGFRQYHKFKMESSGEISDDVKKMAMDYERLLDVLDEVLRSNKSLITLIESE